MLLISLIPEISTTSCKFPIIIVDEPEIGLHNSYIIEFVNCICNHIQKRALMLISTHSPKIISELANHKINYVLYKINRFRLHSTARKMNLSWLNNNLSKITIKETECYFSDYLVYVEGETELQVFYNKKINELFPKLSRIHFYSFDSNNERLKKVHSKSLNLGIDYKLIIDMDKIIQYNNKLHFKLNNDQLLNPIKYSNKSFSELFRYYKGNTEIDLLTLRKKILFLLKNQYENAPDKHYISNPDFCELLKSIINYCRFYNTIVNWSTIEGELITYENIDKFLLFLSDERIKNKNVLQQHKTIISKTDFKEKTVLVLCECNGKTETARNPKEVKNKKIIGDKTSGWIDDWFEYYFNHYIDCMEDNSLKIAQFTKDFPSLSNTLQILNNMVQ